MGILRRLETLIGYDPDLNKKLKRNKTLIKEIYRMADPVLPSGCGLGLKHGNVRVRIERFQYRKKEERYLIPTKDDLLRGSIKLEYYDSNNPSKKINSYIFRSGKVDSESYKDYLKAVKEGRPVESALIDTIEALKDYHIK